MRRLTNQPRSARLLAMTLAMLVVACNDAEPPPYVPPPPEPPPEPIAHAPEDFADICAGKEIRGGVEYTKTAGLASGIAVFSDAGAGGWRAAIPLTLAPWKAKTAGEVQLVVCATAAKITEGKTCDFDDHTLIKHDVSYEISVHDAASAKVLATATYDAQFGSRCPIMHSFASETEHTYASADTKVIEMLTALQPEDAPPPNVNVAALEGVCEGVPARAAAAYDEGADMSPIRLINRVKDGPWDSFGTTLPYTKAISEQRRAWSEAARAGDSLREEAHYPLVACLTAEQGDKARSCPFSGDSKLTLYRATWTVEVIEAKTGKQLGTKTFKASKGACPYIHDFAGGNTELLFPGDDVATFLLTYAKK